MALPVECGFPLRFPSRQRFGAKKKRTVKEAANVQIETHLSKVETFLVSPLLSFSRGPAVGVVLFFAVSSRKGGGWSLARTARCGSMMVVCLAMTRACVLIWCLGVYLFLCDVSGVQAQEEVQNTTKPHIAGVIVSWIARARSGVRC